MAGICIGFGALSAAAIFAHKTILTGYAVVRGLSTRDDGTGICIGTGGTLPTLDHDNLVAYATKNGLTWTDDSSCC